MSNLEIGRLFKAALIIQLATYIVVFLDIPFLRQVTTFIYLSFLPGSLILRIVKLDKISPIKGILFSLGLSIAFLIFVGLLLNEIYPVLGILDPLSTFPSVASICAVILVLYVVTYHRGKDFSKSITTNLKFHALVPLLICVLFMTIFGTILASTSGSNSVLLLLVIVTSLLVLCSFSKRLVPPRLHPLVVIVISFFLIFHVSLISKYLVGYDINLEIYFAKLTYNASFWDRTIPHVYNSMLSVTILPAIYSNFLGLDLNWVFKAVYPLIYSIVPLILYLAYRKLTSSRIAFLSVFLFMSMDGFWLMVGIARR